MSTYIRMTKNPRTGEFTPAMWQDDYFGHHQYGVKFLGEDYYYRTDDLETNDDPVPSEAVNELYGYEKKIKPPMNKSDCCNAEVEYEAYCSQCLNALQRITKKNNKPKPKITKYYQVTELIEDGYGGRGKACIVIANNPLDARNQFTQTAFITDIKLIEIIQEDTNQE